GAPARGPARGGPGHGAGPARRKPRAPAGAGVTNSGSTLRNVNWAMAGMLERKTSTWEPEGEMSSVETLSPSLMRTAPPISSPGGRPTGTSRMFGPFTTGSSRPSGGGTMRPAGDPLDRDGEA